jgi:hypothetical protein
VCVQADCKIWGSRGQFPGSSGLKSWLNQWLGSGGGSSATNVNLQSTASPIPPRNFRTQHAILPSIARQQHRRIRLGIPCCNFSRQKQKQARLRETTVRISQDPVRPTERSRATGDTRHAASDRTALAFEMIGEHDAAGRHVVCNNFFSFFFSYFVFDYNFLFVLCSRLLHISPPFRSGQDIRPSRRLAASALYRLRTRGLRPRGGEYSDHNHSLSRRQVGGIVVAWLAFCREPSHLHIPKPLPMPSCPYILRARISSIRRRSSRLLCGATPLRESSIRHRHCTEARP